MAEILGAELQVDRLISADPTNGVLAALNTGGAAVNLVGWSPLTGDVSYTAPAGTGTNTRRHTFDRPVDVTGSATLNSTSSVAGALPATFVSSSYPNGGLRVSGNIANVMSEIVAAFQSGGGGYAAILATRDGGVGTTLGFYTNPVAGSVGQSVLRGQMTTEGVLLWGTTVATSASIGEIVLSYQKSLRGVSAGLGSSFGLIRATGWGYAPSTYWVTQIGTVGGTVALGYDPSVNANGSFAGDGKEILVQNPVRFIQPNAAQTAWFSMFGCADGVMHIGAPASLVGASAGDLVLPTAKSVRASNATGTAAKALIGSAAGLLYLSGDNEFIVVIGDAIGTGAAVGDVVMKNGKSLRGVNQAGTDTRQLISFSSGNVVALAGWTGSINVGDLIGITYYAAASLPAGSAGANGIIAVDGTNNRFVYYSGGARYYLTGTAF